MLKLKLLAFSILTGISLTSYADESMGMKTTFSIIPCENVVQNLMLKGQADYLPLWDPPQISMGEESVPMEPVFNPTNLIYNNVNYGKGAVLLANYSKINKTTGAVILLQEVPVVTNNCNITWIAPRWNSQLIEERKNKYGDGDGGA